MPGAAFGAFAGAAPGTAFALMKKLYAFVTEHPGKVAQIVSSGLAWYYGASMVEMIIGQYVDQTRVGALAAATGLAVPPALKLAYKSDLLKRLKWWNETPSKDWHDQVAELPDMHKYTSDDNPIDGVSEAYLDWTRQRLTVHETYTSATDLYITLLAYVYTSDTIRKSEGGIAFGNRKVYLGFVDDTSVFVFNDRVEKLKSIPIQKHAESLAWIETFTILNYVKSDTNPDGGGYRYEAKLVGDKVIKGEGDDEDSVFGVADKITFEGVTQIEQLKEQSRHTRYLRGLIHEPNTNFQLCGFIQLKDDDHYNWVMSTYFDKELYKRFLPSYSICNSFILHALKDTDEDIKLGCTESLRRLMSNTVATFDEHWVWNLEKSMYAKFDKSQEVPKELRALTTDTSINRVIVNSAKVICANTVLCASKQVQQTSFENNLLLGQTILLRVLYLIKRLLLTQVKDNQPSFVVGSDELDKIATYKSESTLSATLLEEKELDKYTDLALNCPRTVLKDDMFTVSPLPNFTTYKSHLEKYVPKLLAVTSIKELDKVVESMLSGGDKVTALIETEIATNLRKNDEETITKRDERLNEACQSLALKATQDVPTVELTDVAKFAEIAVKYTPPFSADHVDRLEYALRVVYTCCKACNVSETESEFGESVIIKAPRYDVAELSGFTTQHEYDVRMRDRKNRLLSEDERSNKIKQELHSVSRRITSQNHASTHKVFKDAVNAIYKHQDTKPDPFSSFGYVVYFVRWLASIVAAIGQFDAEKQGQYVKLLIKESSEVLFEFSKENVANTNSTTIQDSQTSCYEFRAKFHESLDEKTHSEDRVLLTQDQLPFVMAYHHKDQDYYYYACQKNIPLQMTPSFVETSEKRTHQVWLDKIGFADIVLYRLGGSSGLGLCVYTDNMAKLMEKQLSATQQEHVELLACYRMMDIPSFSCQFEALPLFDAYFTKVDAQGFGVVQQELKDVVQASPDKHIVVFLKQVMLWALTGNFALPKVDQSKAYLDKSLSARTAVLSGGGNLDITKSYTNIHEKPYVCHQVRALQADTSSNKQDNPYLLGSQPLITNLMGFMLVTANIEPKVAIHVLDMFWEYDKRNDGAVNKFHDTWKTINANQTTNIKVDVAPTLRELGLVVAVRPTTKLVKQQAQTRHNQAPQESDAQKQARQQEESNWLQERSVPETVKHKRTWELIQEYGFEQVYRELSNIIDQRQDLVNALLGHIRDAALRKFVYNKRSKTAYDQAFANYPNFFYLIGDRWYSTSSREAQDHAAKRGVNQAQHFNNQGSNQGFNQGGIGAIPGVGLAGLGAAAMHGQGAFHNQRNMLNPNQQQQQAKGQVTFTNHTTTGQTVHATVNTASEVQDDADKRIQRVYADKLSNRARNLTFTDAQGRSVFTLLPHNILAIVLLLVYAILVLYASSIGTSTYTLLNEVNTQGSSYAANLPDLQKPRMACSTFFGIGVGMIVAFVVSLVEIVNNTRLRQALFIVLMAAPIIVLGAMGVSGASDVCGANSMTSTSSSSDLYSSKAQQTLVVVGSKRKRGTLEQKIPRVAKFFKSVLGTHDSDLDGSAMLGDAPSCTPGGGPNVCSNDMKTSCTQTTACASGVCFTGTCNNDPSAPCATALDCIDDVTRNNMKASDFFFIGIGIGVLLAGFCTLIPGNPFHPDVHDTMHGLIKQKDFSVSSQIKRHWLIYFGLFSLVLLGGAASSLWLGLATPLAKAKDAKAGETIQGPANAQAGVMIGISFVIFFAIMAGGMLHRTRHAKLALEVQSSGILHGQATASNVVLGQGPGQARK